MSSCGANHKFSDDPVPFPELPSVVNKAEHALRRTTGVKVSDSFDIIYQFRDSIYIRCSSFLNQE